MLSRGYAAPPRILVESGEEKRKESESNSLSLKLICSLLFLPPCKVASWQHSQMERLLPMNTTSGAALPVVKHVREGIIHNIIGEQLLSNLDSSACNQTLLPYFHKKSLAQRQPNVPYFCIQLNSKSYNLRQSPSRCTQPPHQALANTELPFCW